MHLPRARAMNRRQMLQRLAVGASGLVLAESVRDFLEWEAKRIFALGGAARPPLAFARSLLVFGHGGPTERDILAGMLHVETESGHRVARVTVAPAVAQMLVEACAVQRRHLGRLEIGGAEVLIDRFVPPDYAFISTHYP